MRHLVTAILSLALLGASLGQAPAVIAGSGWVAVVSSQTWVDPHGYLHLIGEIRNGSSGWVKLRVGATFYDSSGATVATIIGAPSFPQLPPGGASPFDLQLPQQPAIDFSTYEVAWEVLSQPKKPVGALSVRVAGTSVDSENDLHVTVSMTNGTPWQVANPAAVVALRDPSGHVMRVVVGGGPPPWVWSSGAIFLVDVEIPDGVWQGFSSLSVQASGGVSDVSMEGAVASWDIFLADIGPSPFRSDILWLANHDVTRGCGANAFCPGAPVKRDQMASFLTRAFDLPPAAGDWFTDDDDNAHEADINALAAAGLTGGCGTGLFCPGKTITREQMSAFLDRALVPPGTAGDYFTDDEASMFEASINRLAAVGITRGCAQARFCPLAQVSREQMSAFLRRGLSN